jgi:hypothetical protein
MRFPHNTIHRVSPGALMLSKTPCLYAARKSSRVEILPPKNGLVPLGYRAVQGPGPGVKSKNPETVPENSEEVVVPVVFTTTTKSECAGTMNE